MAFRGFTIDDSFEASQGARPLLPQGDYLFEITGITPSREDYEKEPYWRWNLKITKASTGVGVGRSFSHIGTWSPEKQFVNATILTRVGVDPSQLKGRKLTDDYAAFKKFTDGVAAKTRGRRFGGLVADSTYNGKPTSEIVEFFPESDYDERAASAVVAPSKAPSSPNGVSPSASAVKTVDAVADDLFLDDVVV